MSRFKSCLSCVNWPKSEMCGPCKGVWTGFSHWTDAVEVAIAAERSRCIALCEVVQREEILNNATPKETAIYGAYTNGKADGARECARRIRGEK